MAHVPDNKPFATLENVELLENLRWLLDEMESRGSVVD
jgi:hypothetical protein